MKRLAVAAAFLAFGAGYANGQYYGNMTANPYGANRVDPGQYSGGRFGTGSNSPGLYSSDGQFRGNLNTNRYDPDSVANPYGRYGSRYSSDSINNRYGAGSRYGQDSPTNRFGDGLMICGVNGCN